MELTDAETRSEGLVGEAAQLLCPTAINPRIRAAARWK